MDMLIPALFWLSISVSLALSVMGILKDRYWLLLMGAVFFFPISYYFNGSPAFYGVGLFLPIFQVISAAAVKLERKLWAWLFLLPAFSIVFWFIYVAWFNQFSQ